MEFLQIDPSKVPFRNILIAVMAVLILYTCNINRNLKTSSDVKALAYEAQSKYYETKVNSLGEAVNLQKTLIFDRDKLIDAELLKNSELENINSQIKIISDTKIRNILAKYSGNVSTGDIIVKYVDSSGINKDSVVKCIAVGTKFSNITKWYSISGSVDSNGIALDSVSSIDSSTYNLGMQRRPGLKGYFQQWDPTLEVIHSSPYVKTESLQNITLKDKPKWYEKRAVWGGVGFTVGIAATILILAK